MAKTEKKRNDLQTVRKDTALLFIAGGLVAIVIFNLFVGILKLSILLATPIALIADGAICALTYYFLEKRRKGSPSNETLSPVMGVIMFDAVVKMPSPVFICDADERIVWYNAACETSVPDKNNLYGAKVEDVFGLTLSEIRRDRHEKGARLSAGNRSFLAKFNHIKTDDNDFALVMTTETTEIDLLHAKIEGDEVVVCYIIIDNLGEMLQYDSEEYRPAAARIDEILREWANEYGGILKEYERDKYIFITQTRVLDELVVRKFDILDRVRAVRVGETNLPLTISMGVSSIRGSYESKEKAAHAALDMALQRGGDQAVLKSDSSIDFFGGITKTVQKRTNVRARVVSNELMNEMKNASNVLIMGHKRADFDAFGACVGIARIAMYCGARVNIVINTSDRNLIGCRSMLGAEEDFLGVFIDGERALDLLETGTLVVVVDVNNFAITEEPRLCAQTERLAVIDHHIQVSEFERSPDIEYIEPSASAACEIVAEMLEQVLSKGDLTAIEANLILAGITLDTKQFTKNTGTRTFSAAMYLRDCGADPAEVQKLFKESFDDYMREAKFRGNVEIYRGCCAITVVDDSEGADRIIAAKAADNLLNVEGVKASFAVIRMGDDVHLSARSTGEINVQLILEEMGGGGHFDAAGAQRSGESVDGVIAVLKNAIDAHLSPRN